MTLSPLRFLTGLCAALAAASCSGGAQPRSILDAAAIYAANEAVFASIRAAYPGPYDDFVRIPARDPADDEPMDRAFLSILREDIPVAFIDFFPIGNTGADEINVVLWREQAGDKWRTTSLIYFGMALTLSRDHDNMRAFDTCDQSSIDWLEANSEDGDAAVFCKVSPSWYAYQRVE